MRNIEHQNYPHFNRNYEQNSRDIADFFILHILHSVGYTVETRNNGIGIRY